MVTLTGRRGPLHGFTLIELLVVIAIIGLLSSIVLASLNTARAKAQDAKRVSDMQSVVNALELYANANGGLYPPTPSSDATSACGGSTVTCVDDLTALVTGNDIPSLPADPTHAGTWQNYRYGASSDRRSYDLLLDGATLNGQNGVGKGGWCHPQKPSSYYYWALAGC